MCVCVLFENEREGSALTEESMLHFFFLTSQRTQSSSLPFFTPVPPFQSHTLLSVMATTSATISHGTTDISASSASDFQVAQARHSFPLKITHPTLAAFEAADVIAAAKGAQKLSGIDGVGAGLTYTRR